MSTPVKPIINNVRIENATMLFRNFKGAKTQWNAEGKRNFCVLIPQSMVDSMLKDGWNIRWLEPRDPDEERKPYIQVAVHFGKKPPKVIVVTKKTKIPLSEESLAMLDWAEILTVDVLFRPYQWDMVTKGVATSGVKAYLKELYVTLQEGDFSEKYADIPDADDFVLDVA